MNQYQKISSLFRQLADAFADLGGGAATSGESAPDNGSADITIAGVTTKAAECRSFTKRNGQTGYMTKINVKMANKVNGSFFANCIAWTDKPEYQFFADEVVEFVGHFEQNNRGYWDFIISKDGNLKPKTHGAESSGSSKNNETDDDDEPF